MAGHLAHSAACQHIEIEWEIATWIIMAPHKQTDVLDCPKASLAASS